MIGNLRQGSPHCQGYGTLGMNGMHYRTYVKQDGTQDERQSQARQPLRDVGHVYRQVRWEVWRIARPSSRDGFQSG